MIRDRLRVVHLSARLLTGRRYWISALVPLVWPAFEAFRILVGWQPETYRPVEAQNILIGLPLSVLAIFLGVRVIAGEMDRRTLEIAYTVPGGAHRVWLSKLAAGFLIVLVTEAVAALVTYVFCTSFPFNTLYGVLQPAMFFMVLAMGFGAMLKSEAAGAMVCAGVRTLALMTSPLRISPFFNIELLPELDAVERFARLTQNRIGYLLVTAAVMVLTFGRAEQRERLLSG